MRFITLILSILHLHLFRRILGLLFIVFLFKSHNASSQGVVSYVKIRIVGVKNPFCKIDSVMYRSNDTIIPLSKGKHHVTIWSPKCMVIDSVITVKRSDTVKYEFPLKYTKAYLGYKWSHEEYKRKQNQRNISSPVLVGLSVGAAVYINFSAKKIYDLALAEKDKYANTGSQYQMDQYEEEFFKYKKKYTNYKVAEYAMYGVSAALIANYIRILYKHRNDKEPSYNEKPYFTNVNVITYPDMVHNKWNFGLKLNF